jgi:hypothetical protein
LAEYRPGVIVDCRRSFDHAAQHGTWRIDRGIDTARIISGGSITSTAIYTALAPNRFKDFWRE